jgi:hypothetical protein
MNITNEQIDIAIKELSEALKEANQIDREKKELSEKERLNRTRLLNAKVAVRDLRIEY